MYIYCLKNPNTLDVRYIGKTVSIKDRLRLHIRVSKCAKKPTHKEAWIRQLLANNKLPLIEVLEEVAANNWQEREVFWINHYKSIGANLTNGDNGGVGGIGRKQSESQKERVRQRMNGNKLGFGIKWTADQREKMKKRSTWNKGKAGIKHTDEWKQEASRRMSGDNHPMAKLTANIVREIRSKYNGSNANALSGQYSVCYSHLIKIVNNKIWKNV